MRKKDFSKRNLIFRFFSSKKNYKRSFLNGIKIFTILFLVALYLFQVTEMTRDVHTVQIYNRKISGIYEEVRKAEYSFLKSNSVSRTEELMEINDFIKAENVHYINLPELEIASR